VNGINVISLVSALYLKIVLFGMTTIRLKYKRRVSRGRSARWEDGGASIAEEEGDDVEEEIEDSDVV